MRRCVYGGALGGIEVLLLLRGMFSNRAVGEGGRSREVWRSDLTEVGVEGEDVGVLGWSIRLVGDRRGEVMVLFCKLP